MARRGRGRPRVPCLYSRPVNAEFNWWLLIVGLVIGAALTWLVIADVRRREDDLSARERDAEADWIASEIRGRGIAADADAVAEVLRLHRAYLASMPPDDDWESTLDESDATNAEFMETEASSDVTATAHGGDLSPRS